MGQPWITIKIKFNRKAMFMQMKASEGKKKKILQKPAYNSKPICVANKLLNHNPEVQKFLSGHVLDISCIDSGNKLLIL